MSRSRRKPTGKKTAAAKTSAAGTTKRSAAFATAHEFVEKPAPSAPGTKRRKAAAGGAAAGAAAGERAAAAAERSDSTERASVAASQEAAERADRAIAAGEGPAPQPSAEGRADATAEPAAAGREADEQARPGSGTASPAEAGHDPHHPAAEHHDTLHGEHEHERTSPAAIALMALVGIIVVAALTLWLAPKAAPYLPDSIARHVVPGQVALEDRLAEFEATLDGERTAAAERSAAFEAERQSLEEQVESLQAELAALGERLGEGADADARAGLETAAGERTALAERVAALESGLSGLRSEIAAMNQALAAAEGGEGPTNPELATALAQLQSRVESLSSDVQGGRSDLAQRLDALSGRLDEALARADQAETARAEAEAETERVAAAAALNDALARLESRFERGEPYAEALAEVEELTGGTAPAPLAGAAETGVPTTSALADGLSRVSREALAAAPREAAADGPLEGVGSWLRAQVAGRPTVETSGDDVGAILSRIEARLEDGDAAAALAEAESLPEPSRAAIQPWLDRLAARAGAAEALDEWRAGLAAAG